MATHTLRMATTWYLPLGAPLAHAINPCLQSPLRNAVQGTSRYLQQLRAKSGWPTFIEMLVGEAHQPYQQPSPVPSDGVAFEDECDFSVVGGPSRAPTAPLTLANRRAKFCPTCTPSLLARVSPLSVLRAHFASLLVLAQVCARSARIVPAVVVPHYSCLCHRLHIAVELQRDLPHFRSGLTYCDCETVASRLPSPPPTSLSAFHTATPLARDDNSADQYCGAPIRSLSSAEHACTQVPQQHSSSMLTPLINGMDEDGLSWPQSKSLADGVVDYSSLYVAP
jgi:hypothetical protein